MSEALDPGTDACPLGTIKFEWEPGHPWLEVLDGHGVWASGRGGENIGILRARSDAVTRGPARLQLRPGDWVLHDEEACDERVRLGAAPPTD